MSDRVNIDDRYPPEGEIRECALPYKAFYDTLCYTFRNLDGLTSFCDVGCSNGLLLDIVRQNHPSAHIAGIEYFSYHKDAAPNSVKDKIRIWDLRDPFDSSLGLKKYDVIVCTEVGEHIDPEHASTLLRNIRSLMHSGTKLIMSWSHTGGEDDKESDPKHQHLNPLNRQSFMNLMLTSGFKFMSEQSQALVVNSFINTSFMDWWRLSLTVWKVNNSPEISTDYHEYEDLMRYLDWHTVKIDVNGNVTMHELVYSVNYG